MKLITLGTGHGDPNMRRCNSAALLECGGKYYLLDAGDGACTGMIRAGFLPSMLSGVFISHLHDDHTAGITSIVKSALKYREKHPACHLEIYLPQAGTERVLWEWLGLFLPEERLTEITVSAYSDGTFFNDGNISITAIPTCHLPYGKEGKARSYGWLAKGEKKCLLFTGDLSPDFSDFPKTDQYCDTVICELTHFDMKYALPVLKTLSCGELIFTHIYDPWDTPEGQEHLKELQTILPYKLTIAEDGMTFYFGGEK